MVENDRIEFHFKSQYDQTKTKIFQFVSLFRQIDAEKLQNPLFKIIWLHCLWIFEEIDKQIIKLNRQKKKRLTLKAAKYIMECL